MEELAGTGNGSQAFLMTAEKTPGCKKGSGECAIDYLPQSWAVISGGGDPHEKETKTAQWLS